MVPLVIVATTLIFLSYYFAFGSRKPLFIGGKGRLRNILNIVSCKTGVYSATPWSYGGHQHTIFAHIFKTRPRIKYTSENLVTSDKGELRLDWSENEKSSKENIVLILPGLTGTSHEKYVLHFVQSVQNHGYQAVVMNYRGSRGPPKTYRFNCAANSEDLEFVVGHINTQYPESRVCAVGVSLGGIILTNYLASNPTCSLLHAAFVVSIPWDLFVCSDSLEKPVTWLLFNLYLTRKLKKYFGLSVMALRAKNVDVPEDVCSRAKKANSIREFDDAVIAPMFGYQDVNDYYMAASPSKKSLESIKTPLLCLNAADDPFSPQGQIPVERIKNCENVALILTQTGGHVGFLEGLFSTGNGYMTRVFEEYIKTVFQEF